MASQIQGIIINYRVGPKTQRPKECIIQFNNVNSVSEACRLKTKGGMAKRER